MFSQPEGEDLPTGGMLALTAIAECIYLDPLLI